MLFALLADLVALFHLAFVLFVVLGQLAILVGAALRWAWVRNLWFRLLHLAAIGYVALEAIVGTICPLTEWEFALRVRAGQDPVEGDFLARLVHTVLYQDWPVWVFAVLHVSFALLVLATLFLVPPRWSDLARRRKAVEH